MLATPAAALRPSVTRCCAASATSPVPLRSTVEKQDQGALLLHRPEEVGGGGRPRSGLTQGAQGRCRDLCERRPSPPMLDPGGYKDVILFLATAAIVAPLFQRLKLSPILGLLLAG